MAGANTASYASTPDGTRATYRRMAKSTAAWMASQARQSDRFWQADRS